ncbi:MAG: hypothetical protein R6U96_06265 [Promethearchaeia archaeon]
MAKEKSEDDQIFKEFKVNFWRTKLHGEELGPYQTVKYQSKTNYFSKSFDIEGVIEEDGEKKYIIAFNKEEWEENPENKKELKLRIFTIMEEGLEVGSGGNYHGGFELSFSHSLIQSYEIKHPAAVFFVQLPRSKYLTKIVKSYRLLGTRWNWPLIPTEEEDQLQLVTAKGKIGWGKDYDILIGKKKIAHIDGQPVQKEFEIEIYDEDYANDVDFCKLLILFGCICNFMKDVVKIVKKRYKQLKKSGISEYKPSHKELDLFKNPRMVRK